jgi:hypothetical protein
MVCRCPGATRQEQVEGDSEGRVSVGQRQGLPLCKVQRVRPSPFPRSSPPADDQLDLPGSSSGDRLVSFRKGFPSLPPLRIGANCVNVPRNALAERIESGERARLGTLTKTTRSRRLAHSFPSPPRQRVILSSPWVASLRQRKGRSSTLPRPPSPAPPHLHLQRQQAPHPPSALNAPATLR